MFGVSPSLRVRGRPETGPCWPPWGRGFVKYVLPLTDASLGLESSRKKLRRSLWVTGSVVPWGCRKGSTGPAACTCQKHACSGAWLPWQPPILFLNCPAPAVVPNINYKGECSSGSSTSHHHSLRPERDRRRLAEVQCDRSWTKTWTSLPLCNPFAS